MSKLHFLAIATFSLLVASPSMAQSPPAKAAPATTTVPASAAVDINSATKDQLETLKGVGSTRAEAIIKGRPYKTTQDLVDKKILPQSTLDGLKDKVAAHQAAATPASPAATKPAASAATPAPATTTRSTSAGAATPTGEFKEEADAKKHCPSDVVVWANTSSKIYHYAGASDYGKTKQGAYMCQKESDSGGFRAARDEKAPAKN
jgi:hypothetical protein